jgi:hypothetical protein
MLPTSKPVEIQFYPNAGRAFEKPDNKGSLRPQDAADAHARIDRILATRLKL